MRRLDVTSHVENDELIIEVETPQTSSSPSTEAIPVTQRNASEDLFDEVFGKELAEEEAKKDNVSAVMRRFAQAPWAVKRLITVGGAGGIGSNVCYNLTKLGHDLILFEYDVVEAHNIGGQMFFLSDVGKPKATAILKRMNDVDKDSRLGIIGRLEETSPIEFIKPITFSCFDSIAARKILFEKWHNKFKDGDTKEAIFIDGRMTAESFEIFAVTPDQADTYRETFFDDAEVEDLPCNYKATTQTGLIIAGMMVGIMTNFISNVIENTDRAVPFRTEFNIPLMYYETT